MANESHGMHAQGTRVFWNDYGVSAPGDTEELEAGWSEVPDVISADAPEDAPTITKITHLNSPSGRQEKVPGFYDPGQIKVTANYHAALMVLVNDIKNATGEAVNGGGPAGVWFQWVILYPDLGAVYGTGFVAGSPKRVPEDDRVTAEFTVEMTGLLQELTLA